MSRPLHVHAVEHVDVLDTREFAVARSVLYASLFDYPLTLTQLRQTLIECALTPSEILAVYERSEALRATIECCEGFFFPSGRSDLVAERRRREARSRRFLRQNRLLLGLLCAMPYVRMAALSGSIAHLNLEGGGDLDLFIVTRGRRVWSVTVAALVLAKLMRRRRVVCVNFVISDARLELEQEDLFTASQIIHLKPLVGGDVYRRFVQANPFVARFYPNFHAGTVPRRSRSSAIVERVKRLVEVALTPVSAPVEIVCRWAYGWYLRRGAASWRSPDQVRLQADCLKLHTQSHRRSILERFNLTVQQTVGHV